MKKVSITILISILLASFLYSFTAAAYTPTFEVASNNIMLVNTDTGDILYEKNADERIFPASISYLMNAIIVCERTSLDEIVTIDKDVIRRLSGTGAIVANLVGGEEISVRDLLACMLISSHNDAALVLAYHVGGDADGFISMMNEKAKSLGLNNTNYATTVGLFNENQYTTVRDLQKLSAVAFSNEDIAKLLSTSRYTIEPTNKSSKRILTNTNRLIDRTTSHYYKYAVMGKTGTSDVSGRCVVSIADYEGSKYMCIVAGSNADGERNDFIDSANLYRWAFTGFEYKTVINQGEQVPISANVDLSWDVDSITLTAGESVLALLPKDADLSTIEYVAHLNKEVYDAPIKVGDVLGTAEIYYTNPVINDSEPIGVINICAGENVEHSVVLHAWRIIESIITNVFVIIGLILLINGFIILTIVANVKAKKERNKKLKLKKRL